MTNIIKISLKTSKELLLDLKKIIGKELICLASYYGGVTNNANQYHVKDYVDVYFCDEIGTLSMCSITFSSAFLEDYHFFCQKIRIQPTLELGKRENLALMQHGIVISRIPKFIVAKIEIFGDKYESPIYKGNQFKVDMDTFIVFTSLIGEQILVMHTDQSRIIQILYDKSQIERIINESNKKGIKKNVLQAIIN